MKEYHICHIYCIHLKIDYFESRAINKIQLYVHILYESSVFMCKGGVLDAGYTDYYIYSYLYYYVIYLHANWPETSLSPSSESNDSDMYVILVDIIS